jgi:hypothetical protein
MANHGGFKTESHFFEIYSPSMIENTNFKNMESTATLGIYSVLIIVNFF